MDRQQFAAMREEAISILSATAIGHFLLWAIGAFLSWDFAWMGWTGHRIAFVAFLIFALFVAYSDDEAAERDQ